jgi:hypothetical protein
LALNAAIDWGDIEIFSAGGCGAGDGIVVVMVGCERCGDVGFEILSPRPSGAKIGRTVEGTSMRRWLRRAKWPGDNCRTISLNGSVIGTSSFPVNAEKYSGAHSRNSAAVMTTWPSASWGRTVLMGIATNCSARAGTLWLMASGKPAAMDVSATCTCVPVAEGVGAGPLAPACGPRVVTRIGPGVPPLEGSGGTAPGLAIGAPFEGGGAGGVSVLDNILLNNPSMFCLSSFSLVLCRSC